MDDLVDTIGIKLKERRKSLNMTVKEVVALLSEHDVNISEKTLYSWEGCHRQPDAETFMLLCKIYNIKDAISYFMPLTSDDELANDSFKISSNEQTHIKKYRALDERGKETVDIVLDSQYELIQAKKEITAGLIDEKGLTYEQRKQILLDEFEAAEKGRMLSAITGTSGVNEKIG